MAGIILLDDETTNRRLLRGLLERDHHVVWEAANAAELLALLDNEAAPDLAIFDLYLHAESGIELLRRLRTDAIFKGLPVLLCSGSPDRAAVVEGVQLGAAGFLAKPVDPIRLRAGVSKAESAKWMRTLFDDVTGVCRRLSTDRDKLSEMAKTFFNELSGAVSIQLETEEERANQTKQVAALRRTAATLGLDVLDPAFAEWEKTQKAPELLRRTPVLARLFAAYVS